MKTQTEALKQALEALEQLDGLDTETECVTIDVGDVIDAIKKALAQPEQCQCPNCRVTLHASDCAVHNEPAYPKDECNCGAQQYNATSDHRLMENAQGDLEGIKLVQTAVGIGKPEQEPVAWESLLGAVARGWCYEENANKTMDSDLAVAIAKEVQALYTTPPQPEQNLNCKSTQARLATAWGYVKAQPKEPEQEEYLSKAYRLANELRCHLAIAPAPQRTWVGLTEEEFRYVYQNYMGNPADTWDYERAIEAKLKEKNNV